MFNTDKKCKVGAAINGRIDYVWVESYEGKEWATGYEQIDQSREARLRRKHFDIRDLFIYNHFKARRKAAREKISS